MFKRIELETLIPEVPDLISVREHGEMYFNDVLINNSVIKKFKYLKVRPKNGEIQLIFTNHESYDVFKVQWNGNFLNCKFITDYIRRFYKSKTMKFSVEVNQNIVSLTKIPNV
jgi:hypothetical protein